MQSKLKMKLNVEWCENLEKLREIGIGSPRTEPMWGVLCTGGAMSGPNL